MIVPPLRVLVVRADSLGDTILTMPLLNALRSHTAPVEISVLASAGALAVLQCLPQVDRVIAIDPVRASIGERLALARVLRRERFDVTICVSEKWWPHVWTRASRAAVRVGVDPGATQPVKRLLLPVFLTHRVRLPADPFLASPLHEVERYLALLGPLGITPAPGRVSLPLPDAVTAAARARVRDALGPSLVPVALHLSQKWRTEGWRDDAVAGVCLAILEQRPDVGLVVLGGPDVTSTAALVKSRLGDRADGRVLYAGPGEFAEWAALLRASYALVTMDTAAAHLGAALDVPVVDVFEARRFAHVASRWAPWRVASRSIRRDPIRVGADAATHAASAAGLHRAVVDALGELV